MWGRPSIGGSCPHSIFPSGARLVDASNPFHVASYLSIDRDLFFFEFIYYFLVCFPAARCGDGDHLKVYLHLQRSEINERTPFNTKVSRWLLEFKLIRVNSS